MRRKLPQCAIEGHKPIQEQVQWDGWGHFSTCRHCGVMLEREAQGRWHPATPHYAQPELR